MRTNTTQASHGLAGCRLRLLGALATAAILAPSAMAGYPELPLDLGSAGDFVILAKSGISTVPNSDITGDMGVSPITSTAITGFALIMDGSGEFSTSAQVTGRIYASDYAPPTPTKMTSAVSDMETAYTTAAGRTIPDTIDLNAGDISGLTITPGLHKWNSSVAINSDVWLDAQGDPDAIFIFQISGDLLVASGQRVLLAGRAQAKNIFWQVAGGAGARIGTTAHMEGVVLTATAIIVETDATFNGKLLAQTAVTLDQNVVMDSDLIPTPMFLEIVSEHGIGDWPVGIYTNDSGTLLTNTVTGMETLGGTQYVNTGWVMTGNDPLLGTTNIMTMTHTNDAVLTWQWSTNYLLSLSAPNGTITNATAGWKPAGDVLGLSPVADPGYAFDHWEVNGIVQGSGTPLNVTMDQEQDVLAVFAPSLVGNVSWTVTWLFDPRQGFYIGTLTITNPSDAPSGLTAPFWLKVQATEWFWLRFPTGVDDASGMHYVDLSAPIRSLLAGIGNGDSVLDPGESVSVGGIELMGRRTPDGLVMDLQYETSLSAALLLRLARYDFDGDGVSDYGVYHAESGRWDRMLSTDGYRTDFFGYPGTVPVTADWDGDGYEDYGVYHAESGRWDRMLSTDGYRTDFFGYPGTVPVTGDWDGDGVDDYGVYHAESGRWDRMLSTDGYRTDFFGYPGTVPVTADWDGDGVDDFGVYHAMSGQWYRMLSTGGFRQDSFGYPGTVPVSGAPQQ